jgi:hypothetical protein
MSQPGKSPVSHVVSVVRLPQDGMPVTIAATDKQLKLLAKAHGLISADTFKAEFLLKKWRKDGVKITGTVSARIVQSCVVSMEPVESALSAEIDALFVPEGSKLAHVPVSPNNEMLIDFEGPDAPETFSGGMIDAGAVAEEFFALAIDPYPRKPGAALDFRGDPEETPAAKPSPFANLVKLRKD